MAENALYAMCGVKTCEHVWPVVFLPMEARRACKAAARATCPKCGEIKQIFVADQAAMQRYEARHG